MIDLIKLRRRSGYYFEIREHLNNNNILYDYMNANPNLFVRFDLRTADCGVYDKPERIVRGLKYLCTAIFGENFEFSYVIELLYEKKVTKVQINGSFFYFSLPYYPLDFENEDTRFYFLCKQIIKYFASPISIYLCTTSWRFIFAHPCNILKVWEEEPSLPIERRPDFFWFKKMNTDFLPIIITFESASAEFFTMENFVSTFNYLCKQADIQYELSPKRVTFAWESDFCGEEPCDEGENSLAIMVDLLLGKQANPSIRFFKKSALVRPAFLSLVALLGAIKLAKNNVLLDEIIQEQMGIYEFINPADKDILPDFDWDFAHDYENTPSIRPGVDWDYNDAVASKRAYNYIKYKLIHTVDDVVNPIENVVGFSKRLENSLIHMIQKMWLFQKLNPECPNQLLAYDWDKLINDFCFSFK